MVKKIILFVLSLLLIVSTPSYAQNVSTASQSELEAVYASLAQNPPSSLTPNTIEHKASRWEQYKEEKSSTGSAPIAYSAWSNIYNANVTKANDAKKVELAYMASVGWGSAQQSIKVGTQTRRLDIADIAVKKAIEVKAYETGVVYATKDIKNEANLDTALVKDSWKIEWVFKACRPSEPLKTLLTSGNISIKLVP
jgi:hypothetical protein